MPSTLQLFAPETLAALSPASQSHLGPVLAQLKAFLVDNCTTAKDLAEVSQKGLLHRFMDSLPPIILDDEGEYLGEEKKAHLISFEQVDNEYAHLPIIIALAHEGGLVSSLLAPNQRSRGLNITSLVHRLRRVSPQQLICTSGLLPGLKSNQIFRDFMQQMIAKHTTLFVEELNSGFQKDSQNMRHWFHNMEQITGQKARFARELHITVDERNMKTLTAQLDDFDLAEYEQLMSSLVPSDGNYMQYAVLDSLFFSDAYMMLEQSDDTALAVKVLTAKARFWAGKLDPDPLLSADLTEQLVACALFAHPDHFKRAGFGLRNVIGLSPRRATYLNIQDILSGPLAFYSGNRMSVAESMTFGLDRLVAYTQAMLPEFSIDTLLEQSNFHHTKVLDLLKLKGGHSPILEILLAEGAMPAWSHLLLKIIGETQSYALYQPQSLVSMLAEMIKRIKPSTADSDIDKDGLIYLDGVWISDNRKQHFAPAIAANPGLKSELITYLHTLQGVTSDHLKLIGLNVSDVPDIVRKMPLIDQGKLFSQDLGL